MSKAQTKPRANGRRPTGGDAGTPGEATWSVGGLAAISGVSVRTLHWYEQVGLLVPGRAANGYRVYTSADAARLQQIMLYRTCGLELAEIGALLDDPGFDAARALRQHLAALSRRRRELDAIIDTVEKTIRHLEGEPMSDEERFEGLKRKAVEENEQAYGAEARVRYGDDAVDAANAKLLAMDEAAWNDRAKLEGAIIDQLGAAMATGDPHGAEARALAGMHARWIQLHWGDGRYSPEAHLGLARGYLADPRFTAYYDERAGEGATAFLVSAIEGYLS